MMKLKQLLEEAEQQHHAAEKRLPPHKWSLWYASYMDDRKAGWNPGMSAEYADQIVLHTSKDYGGTL